MNKRTVKSQHRFARICTLQLKNDFNYLEQIKQCESEQGLFYTQLPDSYRPVTVSAKKVYNIHYLYTTLCSYRGDLTNDQCLEIVNTLTRYEKISSDVQEKDGIYGYFYHQKYTTEDEIKKIEDFMIAVEWRWKEIADNTKGA